MALTACAAVGRASLVAGALLAVVGRGLAALEGEQGSSSSGDVRELFAMAATQDLQSKNGGPPGQREWLGA